MLIFSALSLCLFQVHLPCVVLIYYCTWPIFFALELYRLDLRLDWNYCRSNNAFATFNCVPFHSIVSPRYGVQNKADIHSVSLAVSLDQLQISVWRQWAKCSHLHGNVNTKTLTFASRLYLTSHGISLDELQVLDNELDVVMNTVTRTPVFPMPLLHDYNEWSNLNLSYKISKKKPVILVFALRLSRKWDRALNTSSFSHPIPQLKLVETSWNQFVIAWLNSMPNLNTSVAWASGSNGTCFKHCDWTDSKWLSTDATWRWSRSPSSSFVWCFSFWALWMD